MFGAILVGFGTIYGAKEAVVWAWNHGQWIARTYF